MKTMPPKGGFLLSVIYKLQIYISMIYFNSFKNQSFNPKRIKIIYLSYLLDCISLIYFTPSTHEAHEHGVGLGAVNFKNPITKQAAYSEW